MTKDKLMKGCGDNSCVVEKPSGMGTNSRCRCPDWKLMAVINRLRANKLTPGLLLAAMNEAMKDHHAFMIDPAAFAVRVVEILETLEKENE